MMANNFELSIIFTSLFYQMEMGLSVVVFLIIAIVVMFLFCLITRYFHKKLQKALEDENEVYSMIDEIRGTDNEEDANGEYEQYVEGRENKADLKDGKKIEFEMTDIKDPLKGYMDDVYGKGKLKRRLEGLDSAPINPETGRSLSSMKSFRPEKLDSKRSSDSKPTDREEGLMAVEEQEEENMSDSPIKRKRKNKMKKENVTIHKYISKIAGYTEDGIFIYEKKLLSVTKAAQVEEKKVIKKSHVKDSSNSFDDTLEVYGFEKGTYCAFKFETTLQIPHMKDGEEYQLTSLKKTESKEMIEFSDFYSLKETMEDET